ncbi:MAG: GNAT family N-acetyltransferase [Anaerolineaceae bacterium]|nr:GNAT family N-acetyltransferase [Anaerolineaceae bacterium]
MNVRHTTMADLPEIREVYAYARELMKKNGNPTQWGDKFPPEEKILWDIEHGTGYAVVDDNGVICGVFAFIIGPDPTYAVIEDGKWLNDNDEYGTIHRIATNGKTHGVFDACIDYCQSQIGNLRIDTHQDNKAMLHLITSRGFQRCGIIYTSDDGTPRIAFQRC